MNHIANSQFLRKTITVLSLLDVFITFLVYITEFNVTKLSYIQTLSLGSVISIFLIYTHSILFRTKTPAHGPDRSSFIILFSFLVFQTKLYTITSSSSSSSSSRTLKINAFSISEVFQISQIHEIFIAMILSSLVLLETFIDFELGDYYSPALYVDDVDVSLKV